ncbi:PQQ-dependent sugar dehydrogenase [Acidicapsa ligni]|uniref:PQQ-dependent sugar dehydrogenase n=1 Tax=Acidicapsa ligni TaxID=542300 RepID=UPI0021DFDA3E|nr:PQQ-dependent sugar dehydrogenase [Acidicapsa ligni]
MRNSASIALLAATALLPTALLAQQVITGQAAFADWNQQQPGAHRKITLADLPQPKPQEAVNNTPHIVPRPADAWPVAPAGFKVTLYAGGDSAPMQRADNKENMARSNGTFTMPRILRTAPNGDLFLADSGAGTIFILRGIGPNGKAARTEKFVTGLDHPFGIAFYPAENPKYVYVGNATTIQRIPYHSGDLHATGAPETIVPDIPGYAQLTGGGHWTRDIVFTKEGHMLVSVGSGSNVDDADTHPKEFHRADVLEYTPEGKFVEVYAHGIRNCVGEAINPITGQLWCSTNERDDLGNHLVPDYVTSIKKGGFYGWPWYYMGGHQDPRLPEPCANGTGPNLQAAALTADQAKDCKRVDLSSKVITPDVLLQPHMASLEMTFYPSNGDFPKQYDGDAFAAEHGSWNRANRAGYEVVHIPMHNGHADGSYEDFLTGFVTKDGQVWGRPVGVATGHDGALYVTDDGTRSVWRVAYTGK